jgi:hypothetical protein
VFNPVIDLVIMSKLVPILFNCPTKAFLSKINLSNIVCGTQTPSGKIAFNSNLLAIGVKSC